MGRLRKTMAEKQKNLEEAFEELNNIISKMDKDDVSLEDSFSMYNQGMNLVKYCNDTIERVEKQIQIVNEGEDADEL